MYVCKIQVIKGASIDGFMSDKDDDVLTFNHVMYLPCINLWSINERFVKQNPPLVGLFLVMLITLTGCQKYKRAQPFNQGRKYEALFYKYTICAISILIPHYMLNSTPNIAGRK